MIVNVSPCPVDLRCTSMQLVDCASARGGAPRPLIRASAVQMTASFFTGRHSRRVECCGWLAKRVTGGSRSACASTLADQERDLHDHLEPGHTGSGRWTRIEDSWVVEQRVGWCAMRRGGEPWRGLLII